MPLDSARASSSLRAVALAVLLTMLQSPRYTSAASVQINDQSERILGQNATMHVALREA